MNTELFRQEIAAAIKAYEKYIVCLNKTTDEFEAALKSLLIKAIKAYEGRGPELRHGIALDKQITVILSQSDGPRPLCGIYFNLHSPYQTAVAAQDRQGHHGTDRRRPAEVRRLTRCEVGIPTSPCPIAAGCHWLRASSPTSASPATRSATMLSSRCGPVTLTSPTFKPRR